MEEEKNFVPLKNKKRVIQNKEIIQKKISQKQLFQIQQSDVNMVQDYRELQIHENHQIKPLLLSPDLNIIVEVFNPLYRIAFEFLMCIADPIMRSKRVHEYRINQMSLYTAMVLQFSPHDIIGVLRVLSKNEPPQLMKDYIIKNTQNIGQAKFYLENEKYYLEIGEKVADVVLNEIKQICDIKEKKKKLAESEIILEEEKVIINEIEENPELKEIQKQIQTQFQVVDDQMLKQMSEEIDQINNNDQAEEKNIQKFRKFKILGDYFHVTQALINTYIPLIQEFDFSKCENKLDITLKSSIQPRPYQLRAVRNCIIKDKARSGLIVLPCGAGKTLVGILCLSQIKCSCIIICDSNVSVDQWRQELEKYTTINSKKIIRVTGYVKDSWIGKQAVVILTTYSWLIAQISGTGNAQQWQQLRSNDWGLCIVDEVHRLPAEQFCNVLRNLRCAVKIGLTATLLREDNKLDNLYYMIGPKLYEENLIDLMNQGYLAKPYIVEILCDLTPIFKKEYTTQKEKQVRSLLHTGNPNKFRTLQFLIKQHELLGHKIIVFCDSLLILNYYANLLGHPVIDGDLNTDEKNKIFNLFKSSNEIKTIFVSRVGDTGIDIPQASVGIEIGYLGGSRRQKVQRLGRVMRPKKEEEGISAYFYSLASKETVESEYSYKRQKYITDQLGLNTELINDGDLPFNKTPEKFKNFKKFEELDLLEQILRTAKQINQNDLQEIKDDEEEIFQIKYTKTTKTAINDTIGIYKFE